MDKMTTRKYISTVAETGSISLAAERLGISQPALSSAIKKKEKELGTILLDRSGKPLKPTASGLAYLEYLDNVSLLTKELNQKINDIEALSVGHLTVGGASFFNISYIPSAVAAFSDEYPGVDIEIVDGSVPELMKKAQSGSLDIFLTPHTSEDDTFEYEEILEERIFLCIPYGWPVNDSLRKKRIPENDILNGHTEDCMSLSPDEIRLLDDLPFIQLGENQQIGKKLSEIFGMYSLRPGKIIQAEQTMTSLALTLSGIGISLVTETSIRNGNMKNFPFFYTAEDKDVCRRKMYVAHLKGSYVSGASREFIRILKKLYQIGENI